MNKQLLEGGSNTLKRIFSLDKQAYQEGVLDVATKELLGLVASTVLRCDDCIKYHLGKCFEVGIKRDEMLEIMQVALIVGGSITIPHIRRAYEYWEELEKATK